MPKSKGAGAKLSRRKAPGKYKEYISSENWLQIERLLRVSLSDEVREKIQLASSNYARIAKLHSADQTISSAKIVPALNAWLKASGRLRISFGKKSSVEKLDRSEIIKKFATGSDSPRFQRRPMLGLVEFFLSLAMGCALTTISEITKNQIDPKMRRELAQAWVKLVVIALKPTGAKITAANSSLAPPSPFVDAILYLENLLPDQCRQFKTYPSAAKGFHHAQKKFPGADEATPLGFLMGVGSGVIDQTGLEKLVRLKDEFKPASVGKAST